MLLSLLAVCTVSSSKIQSSVPWDLRVGDLNVYHRNYFLGVGFDKDARPSDDNFGLAISQLYGAFRAKCGQSDELAQRHRPLLLGREARASELHKLLLALSNDPLVDSDSRVVVDIVAHGGAETDPILLLAPEQGSSIPSLMPMSELKSMFLKIHARQKLLIVDGCKSGRLTEGLAIPDGTDQPNAVKSDSGAAFVWSSARGNLDSESVEGFPSFHRALIETINKLSEVPSFLSSLRDRVEWKKGRLALLEGKQSSDMLLIGDGTSQPPGFDPLSGARIVEPEIAKKAEDRFAQRKVKLILLTTEAQARLCADNLSDSVQFDSKRIASELPELRRETNQAVIFYVEGRYPFERIRVMQHFAYCLRAVGKWLPDNSLLQESEEELRNAKTITQVERPDWDRRSRIAASLSINNDLASVLVDIKTLPALQEATKLFRENLGAYKRESSPSDWSVTQTNLGIALSLLVERGQGNSSKEAILAQRRALEVLKPQSIEWAKSYFGLANSLLKSSDASSESNLKEAVTDYHLALGVFDRKSWPIYWAMTEDNLGAALRILGERGDSKALQESVTSHRLALEVWTRESSPAQWAETTSNLAASLERLGENGDAEALNEAIADDRLVLEVFTRKASPADWAATQDNLGVALTTRGELRDPKSLQDAVVAHRSALQIRTRDKMPLDWASTENNLANALSRLGGRGDLKALKEAVSIYRLILEVFTRKESPDKWAETQNNLGVALESLGKKGDNQAINEAARSYRLALTVYTRKSSLTNWVLTETNLANVLCQLGDKGNQEALRESINTYRLLLPVFKPNSEYWSTIQTGLGIALKIVGRSGDKKALHDSVDSFQQALKVRTRKSEPEYWAMTETNLGLTYQRLGELGDETALQLGVACFKGVLEVWTSESNSSNWTMTQANLGKTLVILGKLGHKEASRAAVDALHLALQGYTMENAPDQFAITSELLGQAEQSNGNIQNALAAYRDAVRGFTKAEMNERADRVKAVLRHLGG